MGINRHRLNDKSSLFEAAKQKVWRGGTGDSTGHVGSS
jgi:hypothetical protein